MKKLLCLALVAFFAGCSASGSLKVGDKKSCAEPHHHYQVVCLQVAPGNLV